MQERRCHLGELVVAAYEEAFEVTSEAQEALELATAAVLDYLHRADATHALTDLWAADGAFLAAQPAE